MTTVLTDRQARITENYHNLCEIEALVTKLNADELDETFGISQTGKEALLTNIRNCRAYLGEIWE